MRRLLFALCAATVAALASAAPTAEAPIGNPDAPAELAYFRKACCECPVESTYCELGYPDTPPDRVACVLYTEENKLYERYQAPVSCCAADGSIDGSQITGTLVSATVPAARVTGTLSSATIPAAQVTGILSNAALPGSQLTGTVDAALLSGALPTGVQVAAASIGDPINILIALGMTGANTQAAPGSSAGVVLQCNPGTVRIGSCPPVTGACQLASSDASTCDYQVTVFGGSCPDMSMLCA